MKFYIAKRKPKYLEMSLHIGPSVSGRKSFKPLNDEAKEFIQNIINEVYRTIVDEKNNYLQNPQQWRANDIDLWRTVKPRTYRKLTDASIYFSKEENHLVYIVSIECLKNQVEIDRDHERRLVDVDKLEWLSIMFLVSINRTITLKDVSDALYPKLELQVNFRLAGLRMPEEFDTLLQL